MCDTAGKPSRLGWSSRPTSASKRGARISLERSGRQRTQSQPIRARRGLRAPPPPRSRASCGPSRCRRSGRVSRARAGRQPNVPTGPPHPSRWRPSYGSNGWSPHRSQRAGCPMSAHYRLSHQAHRVRGCHAGVPVPKRRRLSPALPSPQVRRPGVGLSDRAGQSGEAGDPRNRRQPSWQRSLDRAHPVGPE